MARLSQYEIGKIRNTILKDLYGKAEETFELRKTVIAERNRQLYLQPIQHLLDQIPEEMVAHFNYYGVKIQYKSAPDMDNFEIAEEWQCHSKTPIPNPTTTGHYPDNIAGTLHPKLQQETAVLCNEILAINNEKSELAKFIDDSTSKYTGSIQLRKVWPESLHKYLPAEKHTDRSANKKATTPDPVAPTTIQNRMTTNLLEGN